MMRTRILPRESASTVAFRLLSTYGLFALLIVLLIVFSLLLPNTFPTAFNLRSILSDKSVIALLALAEMMPIAAGQFDLSIGYHIGLAHILVVGLQVNQHLPWPLAVASVLAFGVVVGLSIGLLVVRAQIDAFIASLGVGTILYGIAFWYAPNQIVGQMEPAFRGLAGNVGGVPVPFVYVAIVSMLLFIVLEYLPLGRFLYVLGANRRAAELVGIPPGRFIPVAFALSGLLTAFAGVVLGAKLGVAQTSVGPDYLLPAFVGALLGSTSIRPGRVNVLGTLVAVFVLAVAVAGLQQLGAQFFVEPLFNGCMLVLSVGLAAYASRRRARVKAAADAAAVAPDEEMRSAEVAGAAPR
ncbi:MAG: ABC transporter permease [Chloroflexi bacterium]|nr:ABC transporter permease [Chloroflexota bacterium]